MRFWLGVLPRRLKDSQLFAENALLTEPEVLRSLDTMTIEVGGVINNFGFR
jgi:hypothetical protein